MKIKKLFPLIVIVALALMTTACIPNTVKGNGNVEQETRSIESFDYIELNGMGNVHVELGDEPALEVSAEENLLPYIKTYVRGDSLIIEIKDNVNIVPTEPLDFYITAVALTGIEVSGLADVELPAVETERFTIDVSGAGNINMDELVADSLDVKLSGLGSLDVDGGEVGSQVIDISGSGGYNARHLESQETEIVISGLGSATVSVSDYLRVNISGGGDVNYYGNPEVDSNISGLGDIDRLGD